MSKIASPLTLDLTNTRAFKTWLYDLWQSTGGTTSTAIEDIDVYLSTPAIDVINGSQLDQVLLMQIRDELSEINKKLDEIKINERTVLDDVNRKFDEIQVMNRTVVDEVNNKLDELQTRDRSVIDELSRKIDDIVLLLGVVA